MSTRLPPTWLKKTQKALLSAVLQPRTDETQSSQPTQPRRTLRRWGWVVVVMGGVAVGGRLLFFEVEGNPLQLPLKARDWPGFGESYDNNVSVVTEKATEADGKTTKQIDKAITTQKMLQPAKTLWDWASLLLAPATLAGLGFLFQSSQERAKRTQEEADKARDADQQRETALQDYFDYLSALLVDKRLKQFLPVPTTPDAEPTSQGEAPTTASPQASDATAVSTSKAEAKIDTDAALDVVKAKTLALFRLFDQAVPTDMARKASVFAFLGDTGLLTPLDLDLRGSHWANANLRRAQLSGFDLYCADFNGADLEGANLTGADFNGVNLTGANLNGTNLLRAKLEGAFLLRAHLKGADFKGAVLKGAILWNARITGATLMYSNLSGADLMGADLSDAILLDIDLSETERLNQAQLEGDEPPLLCHVTLPEGFTVDPQRDCAKLPAVLLERYPKQFKDLEAAKTYADRSAPPE